MSVKPPGRGSRFPSNHLGILWNMSGSSVYLDLDHSRVDGRARNVLYRQKQLFALHDGIKAQAQRLIKSLQSTSNISQKSAALEVYLVLSNVKKDFQDLDFKKSIEEEKKIKKGTSGQGRKPYGLVRLAVKDCGNVFFDTISALSAIIAAGNCCLVDLQDVESSATELIADCMSRLDSDSYALSDGELDGKEDFDYTFSIGVSDPTQRSTRESSGCFQAPAAVVVDHTADLSVAAEAISEALEVSSAKSTQRPSELLVHSSILTNFKQTLDTKLAQKGQKSEALKFTSVSSIDNAIDVVNAKTHASHAGAVFLFGGTAHAKYVAQHTNAASYYVNHIPTHLLIGSIPRGSVVDPDHRYKAVLFSTDTSVVQAPVKTEKPLQISALQKAISLSLLRLPKQRAGKRLDFFLQGIILFFGSGLLMTLAGTGFSVHRLGKLAYKYRQVPAAWIQSLTNK